MSKALRIKLSTLSTIIIALIEGLIMWRVMPVETLAFWIPVTVVLAVMAGFGINDALRKAAADA